MITTKPFKISATAYGKLALMTWLTRWWWLLFTIALATVVSAFFDLRLAIAGAAIVLIAYPALLMFLYYNYTLHPLAAHGVRPQQASFKERAIHIEYLITDEHNKKSKMRIIPYEQIKDIEVDNKMLNIYLDDEQYSFLLIPLSAFASANDISKALSIFPDKKQ